MSSHEEACSALQGPYLAEKLTPEQVQRGSELVAQVIGQWSALEGYSPTDSWSAQHRNMYLPDRGEALDALETALSSTIHVNEQPAADGAEKKYVRIGWLTNALESLAIQNTMQYFLPAAHVFAQHPDMIERRSDYLSPLSWIRRTLHDEYVEAQRQSRAAATKRGDQKEFARYAALDTLVPMLTSLKGFVMEATSRERERSGFITAVNSTVYLLKHIYVTLNGLMSSQYADGCTRTGVEPPELTAMRADIRAATAQSASGRARQLALYGLAVGYTSSSVTAYAHTLMDLNLDQLVGLADINGGSLEGIASRTVPVAIGRAALQVRFQHEHVEAGDENWQGSIAHGRTLSSEHAKYRCPARRPAANTPVQELFASLFQPGVHRRFSHSTSDMTVFATLAVAEQYIPYLANLDESISVSDRLARPL